MTARKPLLLLGCGALGKEIMAVLRKSNLQGIEVQCLPAKLHNEPKRIPEAVRAKIRRARARFERIIVLYGDCGTGGLLDEVLEEEGVTRIAGAHCYEFYMGSTDFTLTQDRDPCNFYLTDFLVRHFDRLVIAGLGLDRHPELLPLYFGNYKRLIYLAQTNSPELFAAAQRAAERLKLAFECRHTGYGELEATIDQAAARVE